MNADLRFIEAVVALLKEVKAEHPSGHKESHRCKLCQRYNETLAHTRTELARLKVRPARLQKMAEEIVRAEEDVQRHRYADWAV